MRTQPNQKGCVDVIAKSVKYLEGEHVYLRYLEPEDTDDFFTSDPEVRRLTGTQRPFSRRQIAAYIERITEDPTRVQFGIFLQETDQLIGDIAIMEMDNPNNRCGSFRIAIDTRWTGQGYGTEATKLMLDYGFGMLNLHRIQLDVYTINERAIHVYEKLGFQREGVMREAWRFDHGYYDIIIMAILEDDYRALRQQARP